MVGVARVVLGLARLGVVAYLMSDPVLVGFTSGAAVLISASQVPTIFGTSPDDDGVLLRAWSTLTTPGEWQLGAILFASGTVIVVVLGRRIHRLFPGILMAVVGATVISVVVNYGGAVVGELPGGFLEPSVDLAWGQVPALIVPALAIALVGFAEASSIARTFAVADRMLQLANRQR